MYKDFFRLQNPPKTISAGRNLEIWSLNENVKGANEIEIIGIWKNAHMRLKSPRSRSTLVESRKTWQFFALSKGQDTQLNLYGSNCNHIEYFLISSFLFARK